MSATVLTAVAVPSKSYTGGRAGIPLPVWRMERDDAPKWHGPAGGHDHGTCHCNGVGPWQVWDALDIHDFLVQEVARLTARCLFEGERHWRGLGTSMAGVMLVAQVMVLGLHVRWARPLATPRHRSGARMQWACILLAWSSCGVGVAATGRGERGTQSWGYAEVPQQSDIELWSSGQMTVAEQMAQALQRYALDLPLSSGGCTPSELRPGGPTRLPPPSPVEIQPDQKRRRTLNGTGETPRAKSPPIYRSGYSPRTMSPKAWTSAWPSRLTASECWSLYRNRPG